MSSERINEPVFEDIRLSDYGEDGEEEEKRRTETPIDEETKEPSLEMQEGEYEPAQDERKAVEAVASQPEGTRDRDKRKSISKTVWELFQQDTTEKESSFSYSSESLQEIFPTGSFIYRKKLPAKKDFFQILGHLPDIDQISLPESLKRELQAEEVASGEGEDEEGEGEGSEPKPEEKLSDQVKESSLTEYSEFEFSASEPEEELEKKVSDIHLFERLVKEEEGIKIEEFDYEHWQRKQVERQLNRETQVFLNLLIDYVVETAEYVDPKTVLRQNLNKNKLYHKLVNLLGETHVERKVNDFLQRKCADYYRRQKIIRPIMPDPSEMLDDEMKRCEVIYENLDCLLGRENGTKEITTKRVAELEAEEAKLKEEMAQECLATEQLIKNTIRRRGSDRLNVLADRKIKTMATMRPEISTVRSMLIQRQHTMAMLAQKAAAAEDLGGGLYLRDFHRLENETYALGRKLEEQTFNLHRIRHRYYAFTDTAAHVKEKQTMMMLSLRVQKSMLRNAQIDRENLREHKHHLKLSRMRVQKEIQELSFKNGLIARPALMLDFDETIEKIEHRKVKVDKMRSDLEQIENKVARLAKYPQNI